MSLTAMDKKKLLEYCFGCLPEVLPETVIVSPVLSPEKFTKYCEKKTSFKGRLFSGAVAQKGKEKFAVLYCGVGDRLMGDAVLLLEAASVRRIIFVGTCGGLRGSKIGDLIVCESAFDGEGFTRYHRKASKMKDIFDTGEFIPADSAYTEKLRNFLLEKMPDEAILKSGDVFTIGSLLAEQRENLLSLEEKGFKGIDMELSAVYHAAHTIACEATGLVLVSDLPLEKPLWEELTSQERGDYNSGMKELIRLSVEFAARSK